MSIDPLDDYPRAHLFMGGIVYHTSSIEIGPADMPATPKYQPRHAAPLDGILTRLTEHLLYEGALTGERVQMLLRKALEEAHRLGREQAADAVREQQRMVDGR